MAYFRRRRRRFVSRYRPRRSRRRVYGRNRRVRIGYRM